MRQKPFYSFATATIHLTVALPERWLTNSC